MVAKFNELGGRGMWISFFFFWHNTGIMVLDVAENMF